MINRARIICILLIAFVTGANAQHVEINATNKTIAVSADAEVTTDAEIAILHLGYTNYGNNKDLTYKENASVADSIVKALLQAGISVEQIETTELFLDRVEAGETWTPEQKKERQFKARQSWNIKVPVARAEQIVEAAVVAGANESNEPNWDVLSRSSLQAKAGAAALKKAQDIAQHMADGLNVKIKALVYASNKAPALTDFLDQSWARNSILNTSTTTISVSADRLPEPPKLKLFPQKIKQDATVFAVFSIE